jgi:hypothetical protein
MSPRLALQARWAPDHPNRICTDKYEIFDSALIILSGMCRRVTCSTCSKPTWAGCGAHIESVLGDVPTADRCQGHAPGDTVAKRGFMDWLRSYKTPA